MASLERVRLTAEAIRHVVPDLNRWLEGSHPDVRDGLRQLELGHYEDAEKRLQKVVSDPKIMPAAHARRARILLALATAQCKQKKLSEAAETAESARRLFSGPKSKPGPELPECLDLLGQIRLEEEDLEGAEELFQKALDLDKSVPRPDPKVLTTRYRRLAATHWQATNLEPAREALQKALEFAEKGYGDSDALTADAWIDLGQCEVARENYDDAKKHLEKGLQIHRQACGPDSEEVARDYQALASAAQAAGDLAGSVAFYEKALRLRERQLGGNAAEFAMLLMDLADIHVSEGESSKGVELLQQAVGKLEGARDERVASALNHLALAYVQCGRVDDAFVALGKARKFLEKDPDRNPDALGANTALLQELKNYLPARETPETSHPGGTSKGAQDAYSARLGPLQEGTNANQQRPPDMPGAPVYSPSYPTTYQPANYQPNYQPSYQPSYPANYPPASFAPAYSPPAAPPVFYGPPQAPPAPVHGPPVPAPGPAFHSGDPQPPGYVPAPVGYFPYYPAPAPLPQTRGDSGVQLSLVRPDGTPVEPGSNQTVHLTVMVPDGGIPQKAIAVSKEAPAPKPEKSEKQGLTGWEDLAFDFLKSA